MIDRNGAWLLNDISDDHYGLWEVDWAMNSKGFDISRDIRTQLVIDLIESGMIEVRFGKLGDDIMPLSKSEGVKTVSVPDNWRPRVTPDQSVVSLTTSESGENFLNRGTI